MFGGWTMPAYFFRSEPGAAELRRLARGENGRVCQRVLILARLVAIFLHIRIIAGQRRYLVRRHHG